MDHIGALDFLSPENALEVCRLISFNPLVSSSPYMELRQLSAPEQLIWIEENTQRLEAELCSMGSFTFGSSRSYMRIVLDLAIKMGASISEPYTVEHFESALIVKLWNDALAKMTPEAVEELKQRSEEVARKYGKSLGGEVTGFAALGVAQISGFGVYMLGSTVLGAINGALGLGLGFGAFTGLASLISTVIGPLGWTALGLFTVLKLGSPNYKKLLPAVVFIATQRALATDGAQVSPATMAEVQLLPPTAASSDESATTPLPVHVDVRTPVATPGEMNGFNLSTLDQDFKEVSETNKQRKAKAKLALKQPPSSKMDRLTFDLKASNKPLSAASQTICERHYLDLSADEQQLIREIVHQQQELELEAAKELAAERMRNIAVTQPADPLLNPKSGLTQQKRKEFCVSYVNLQFTDRTLERLRDFEIEQRLYLEFLSQFRLLNEGNLSDKHEVPKTKPKIFMRDCGRDGKIYYRRNNGESGVMVELIGRKLGEDRDYTILQAR